MVPPEEPAVERLYHDPEFVQFYDLHRRWNTDFDYCLRLAKDARSILDLGCGTGLLTASLAEGRAVSGVDPAGAMLDAARRRPGGERVTWVEADARTVRLDRQFDLVLLTGHAFQVFLTDQDQRAVLETIAWHLAPGGRFVFDTRNPAAKAWLDWTPVRPKRRLEHAMLGPVEAWADSTHDAATGIVAYETHYRIVSSGREISAVSRIRFTPRETLAARVGEAGLEVGEWLGDWTGAPCTPTSPEIIPLGRLRSNRHS